MRDYINTANINKLVSIMSEENERVKEVLDTCVKIFDDWQFICFCHILDDMNIRGNQIEYIYYEYFQENFDRFIAGVNEREQNMIGTLNSTYLSTLNDMERINQKACKSGAERSNALYLPNNDGNMIRIIDNSGNVQFEIDNGQWMFVERKSKTNRRESQFFYLDDYHFRCDGNIYHCLEFAKAIAANNYHIYPSNRHYTTTGRTIFRNNKDVRKFMNNKKKKGA